MPVTTEQIDPSKVALTITVEPEKVKAARDKAYNQFAREITIPGFRKGKVPPHLIRTYVDKDRVNQRALELMVGPAYSDALAETQTEPFGGLEPDFELVEMNEEGPVVFKALVPLRPVITLGPYKGLELERRTIEITDEDVDRQIEEIRTRNAQFPQITDRPVQLGDVILGDIAVVVHGSEDEEEDATETRSAVIEVGKNVADFDNGLVGMQVGETKSIDATYPDDFSDERLRGKNVTFTVDLKEIREKILPDMDEAFVQKVHQTAKTPDEFRTAIREGLEEAAKQMAENQLEFDVVGKIVGSSQIHFPDALLKMEMRADYNRLSQYLQEQKTSYEDYLENEGKTKEEFEAEVRNGAASRIRNSLVLSEIARAENITIDDADVDKVLEERAAQSRVSVAALRAFIEKNEQQMAQIRDQALTEKILQFLKDASTVTERRLTADDLRQEQEAAQAAAAPVSSLVGTAETVESAEPAAPLAVTAGVSGRRGRKAGASEGGAENPAEQAGTADAAAVSEESQPKQEDGEPAANE